RQGSRATAVDVLCGDALQPRGHLAEAARAVCGGVAHRARALKRAARAHPRRPQRRRDAPGSGRGHFPAGDVWRHAGGRRGARRLGTGVGRAGRAVPGRGSRGAMTGGLDAATLDRALAAAVDAARAAGTIAMKYYTGGFDVIIKPDDTPVTQADREAEQAIVPAAPPQFPH